LLDSLELPHQLVVIRVRDDRVVQHVVAVIVVSDLPPELVGPLLCPPRRAHRWVGASADSSTACSARDNIPSKSHFFSRSRLGRSVRSKWTGVTEMRSRAIAERSEPSSSSKEGSKP